jgi:transposase
VQARSGPAENAELRAHISDLETQLEARKAKTAVLRIESKELRSENERLKTENEALRHEAQGLRDENAMLKRRLEEAQRSGKRQAAPFRRRKRKANPKKPGRKPGHAPAHRPVPDHVDKEVDVPLGGCPHCGGDVDEHGTDEQYVDDVQPVRPHVTKYVNHHGRCKRCGRRVDSRHPDQTSTAKGAASVVLGPQVLAWSVELKERLGVTYAKVAGVLMLFFQFSVSAGALARAAQRIAKRAEPTYAALLEYLRASAVVHVDETGWYIATGSKKAWLWVFTTPEGVTVYAIRRSRGGDVPRAILGESFPGTLVVDGWVVYTTLGCPLAQCIAHLFRRCAELLEVQRGDAALFPQQVKELLQGAMLLRSARDMMEEDRVPNERIWNRAVKNTERKLAGLLGPAQTDEDNERFRKHLLGHQDEILVFLRDPAVAPTNNLAEREIRPAVLARKVSAGNRTDAGAHTHEILASLTRTGDRGGVTLAGLLPELLKSDRPVVLTPERFGLKPHPNPTPHDREHAHAPASSTDLRHQGRRMRRVDRAHPPTAPP